ncbi:MAG: 2-C-methyl-D-erythritol 2,4-cyclodiphosphate synthase [Planctomycetota bacterium]|jgi:2-C-methyl-D-erythritol 2,4-cyclodiphosphate synthase|nr:2-C-methyl-D-erythritol 2,4-cyclodiphosphate synthase [Planctomycetota bacterium]
MSARVGFGSDIHRLEAGNGLWLGGILIPCSYQAVAHSDGDALLHALVDAIIGALGQGDIGDHYPESKTTPGEASSRFVREVVATSKSEGWRFANVDMVIDLENPRLAEWKEKIRQNIAALLGIEKELVNIKAKTREGIGAVGKGKAVSAQAVVLLERRGDTKARDKQSIFP